MFGEILTKLGKCAIMEGWGDGDVGMGVLSDVRMGFWDDEKSEFGGLRFLGDMRLGR